MLHMKQITNERTVQIQSSIGRLDGLYRTCGLAVGSPKGLQMKMSPGVLRNRHKLRIERERQQKLLLRVTA